MSNAAAFGDGMALDVRERAALLERLSRHDRLRAVPSTELEWLVAHGERQSFARGALIARNGDARESFHLYIILSGRISTYVERARIRRKLREVGAGEFAGVLPFSRMVRSTADIIVEEALELLRIDSGFFPELIRECPGVTAACVHSMLDRARMLTESDLHDEKLFALGKLAAGLAHELNNPAAAALRSVASVATRRAEIEAASDALVAAGVTQLDRQRIREFRSEALSGGRLDPSPLARADHEDAIADWLTAHGVDAVFAAPLASANITTERLDAFAASIPTAALEASLAWVAGNVDVDGLIAEISQALRRIHELIASVKSFTQMDRALLAEPISIATGVRDTVAVMEPRARARSVAIAAEVSDDLPHVRASAVELNQVWAILLDNAIDAAPASSRVHIFARRDGGYVRVSVVDTGSGIAEEIRGRIFDPFFTTKPVGQGRGLGLDIARRIVTLLGGSIEFDSTLGHTEFCVSLPVVAPATDGPVSA